MRRSFHLAGCLATALLGGCAGASRSSEAPGATPASVVAQGAPGDSAPKRKRGCARVHETLLAQGPVYAACEVDTPARIMGKPSPTDYRPRTGSCVQASIEMVIDQRGEPVRDLVHIVKTNDQEFATAVIRAFQSSTFTPARKDGQPVRSVFKVDMMAGTVAVVTRSGVPTAPTTGRARRC